MSTNRRKFVLGGVSSICALAATQSSTADDDSTSVHSCLDYGLSFICNRAAFNSVRFWVESRTTVIDAKFGTSHVFYQCGSCKSEHTFAEKDLLIEDNYDFLPILGAGDWLIFRRPCRISDRYREVTTGDLWGEPIMKLRYGRHVTQLETWEQIRDTTAAAIPIVSQTEIHDEQTGLRAIIECPVKTMNIQLDDRIYQVDTGPIAFPDLTRRFERPIECLSLAFVVFNAPHFADFVIEQPTPVVENEKELCQVYHYSQPFSRPAENRLLTIALPE